MRKKGRNTLTMLGVFIGVFALTMIISLGQGLMEVITGTVSDTQSAVAAVFTWYAANTADKLPRKAVVPAPRASGE